MKRLARGFTLIEILVATAIGAILVSGGLAAYRGIGEKQAVQQSGETLRSNLRLFQQKALSGEKPDGCEGNLDGFEVIYVDQSSYTAGALCSTASPESRTYNLAGEVQFGSPFSPETIFFPVLRSELTGAQTIILTNGSFSYQLDIEATGVIRGQML